MISFTLHVSKVSLCHSMYQYFISFYRQIKFHCMGILYSPYPFLSWWTFEYLCFVVVIGIAAMNSHGQAFYVDIFSLPLNIVAPREVNIYIYISATYGKPTVFQAPYIQH